MDVFKVIFDKNNTGVYCISLVDDPAIDSLFLALGKTPEEMEVMPSTFQLKAIDNERRIVMGAVLIPDKLIPRKQKVNGEEKAFNIVFPKETIEQACYHFSRSGFQNESNLGHVSAASIEGVTFGENWIKEDEVHDKSVKYGFDEPVGTWFTMMKVDNDELWDDYIKTGKVKGFSVEAMFSAEKVKLKSDKMSKEKEKKEKEAGLGRILLKAVTDFLGLSQEDADKLENDDIKLGKDDTLDGETSINFDGDVIAQDSEVWLEGPDGEKLPVPDGKYKLASGVTIEVVSSIVTSVAKTEDKPADTPPTDAPVNMSVEEVAAKAAVKSEERIQKVFYALAKITGRSIDEMKVELTSYIDSKIDEALSDITPEITKLSKTRSEEKPQKPWEEMTPFERRRASKTN